MGGDGLVVNENDLSGVGDCVGIECQAAIIRQVVHHELCSVGGKRFAIGQAIAQICLSMTLEERSARILRRRGPLRITETHHGFINANAGIDLSNTDDGTAVLLPKDPDRSARRFRGEIQRRCHVEVAVIITDTFGRVWRVGVTDVAIGSA